MIKIKKPHFKPIIGQNDLYLNVLRNQNFQL